MTSRGAWVEILGAAAVGAVEIGGAIALQLWFDGLPYDERPIPVLDAAPWILVGLSCFALLYGCLRAARRRREPGSRVATGFALAGHVLLTVVGAVAVLGCDPDFPFGYSHDDTLQLPDGRTAYLYRGGLFCDYDVFVATPDDWFSYRVRSIDAQSCLRPGRLVLDGERIEVVDEHGEPMPDVNPNWGFRLDIYPH